MRHFYFDLALRFRKTLSVLSLLAFDAGLDWSEGEPVDGAGAVSEQSVSVLESRVALVLGEVVEREAEVVLRHDAVSRHLGDDGGRSDAVHFRITLDKIKEAS